MKSRVEIAGLSDEEVNSLLTMRNYQYHCDTVAQLLKGACPFCKLDREKNQVIFGSSMWIAFKVPVKYRAKHLQEHILIIPVRHMTHIRELNAEEWATFFSTINHVDSLVDLPGGGLIMRFGDPALNAGSVRHLHWNVIVPDGTGEYRTPLAKDPAETEKKWQIMAVYEKMRAGGIPFDKLELPEQELVKDRV
jgi:diadenosine tetraphosphate (Ap4A) HIT family hydrolase